MIYSDLLIHTLDDVILMARNTVGEDNKKLRRHYSRLKALLDIGTEASPEEVEEAVEDFRKHDPEYLAKMYEFYIKEAKKEGVTPDPRWSEFIDKVKCNNYGTIKKSKSRRTKK